MPAYNPRLANPPIIPYPTFAVEDSNNIPSHLDADLNPSASNLLDTSISDIIVSNCSLPMKSQEECSYVQFEALVNLTDRRVCKCYSRISSCDECGSTHGFSSTSRCSTSEVINYYDHVSIFAITPTYARLTQKVDLTSLCYTIENVPNFIWIVVEDSDHKSSLVSSLLTRCKVSVYNVHSKLYAVSYSQV